MNEHPSKQADSGPGIKIPNLKAQSRLLGIKEIRRLCDEALDHDTSWTMFCELVRTRLEIESNFINPPPLMPPNAEVSHRRADVTK